MYFSEGQNGDEQCGKSAEYRGKDISFGIREKHRQKYHSENAEAEACRPLYVACPKRDNGNQYKQ